MENNSEKTIKENYEKVQEKIYQAAAKAGRDPQEIKLVVVTKGHPLQSVNLAVQAGIRLFGENYVEEAQEKIVKLSDLNDIEWHMIGHIQSRKAKQVIENFDCAHSVDSMKVSKRLNRFAEQIGKVFPVLFECNVSGEETKYGFVAWQEEGWSKLRDEFEEIISLPNLDIRGLMTMAPFFSDPEQARPYFRRLYRFLDYLRQEIPSANWQELSMGMSADFEVAVEEGATLVRVGTAIMGHRPSKNKNT
jgi:pyridoxal phosphate enzyme (YggS family)